jgi:osmotically-inducible protein OsmY
MRDGRKRRTPGGKAATGYAGRLILSLRTAVLLVSAVLGTVTITGRPVMGAAPTAAEIEQAIRQHLPASVVSPRSGIDIRVDKGVVALSGTVENLLQKHQARRVAESIRGVRAVIDLITVTPVLRRDEDIGRNVRQAFAESRPLKPYDLAVAVRGGVVTLKGAVDAWGLSWLARRKAMAVKGVSDVHNRIDVKLKVRRSDDEIRRFVKRRLAADLYVDASRIDVRVRNGVVHLAGVVGTVTEKRRAVKDVRMVGVDDVNAQALKIDLDKKDRMRRTKAFVALPDETIRQAVRDALSLDPRVSAYSINVAVADGLVTLTGRVNTLHDKNVAEIDVLNTTGVWRVENKLTLRYRSFPTDEALEKRIAAAFERDAELHARDIHIAVEDFRCRLYGEVSSVAEKVRAENIASQIGGVLSLENNLRIKPAKQASDQPGDVEIGARIREELYWSPFVDSDRIRVAVGDARAILQGAAAGLFAAHSAVQNAFEGGAKTVRTELALDTGKRLDAFFKRDAYEFHLGRIFEEDSL